MLRSHRFFMPGFASVFAVMFAFTLVTVSCIPGCKMNPVSTAQTLDQKAYAVYGTFVVMEESAAGLKRDPNVAPQVKLKLVAADARAKPSADALLRALRDYDAATLALKAGDGTASQLSIATANLNTWIAQATADVDALVTAVHGVSTR